MKRFILLALLAHGAAAAAPKATLYFANEENVSGTPTLLVKRADGKAPDIVVESPSFTEPVTLAQAKMLEMRFETPPPAPLIAGGHYAMLTMNNGDTVRGDLTAMDDTSVTIRTAFAGDLKFRREMVEGLRIVQRPTVLYSPKPEDWKLEPAEGGWSVQGSHLIADGQGSASTKVEYPERFRLGLDLEWKTGLRFHILFLTNQEQGEAGGGYDLFCQERYVYLRKREGTGIRGQGGFIGPTANLSDFSEKEKLRLELLVDTRSGFMALMLDGRTMQEWTDPTPTRHTAADRLEFSTEDTQQLRVSRVTLSPWDGNIEALSAEDPAVKLGDVPATSQQIVLRNGDVVVAETLKVADGNVDVKTEHGDIKIPIARMRVLAMPKPPGNPPTPKKMPGDVRAWFPEGGRITFRMDDLKDGKFTGFSQQFGTAEFDISAFERIEMNLGNLELEPQRPKLGW
jgi:hypothetical protein